LVIGEALNFWRLLRWRGLATTAESLLLVLHVGYAGWCSVPDCSASRSSMGSRRRPAAIHSLTAGAIGAMTLAVMTRATRGGTGRDLSAHHGTNAIYLLFTLAAITRIAAAFAADWAMPLLIVSAGFWITAFMGFVLGYGPMLLSRPQARHQLLWRAPRLIAKRRLWRRSLPISPQLLAEP
jgi:uncharacterized protein involved in response to NO